MSLLNSLISAIKYEVREIAKNSIYRTTLLVLPFVTLLFFATIFYSGTIAKLPIIVVDNDHTAMSQRLLGMIQSTRAIEIWGHTTDIREAEALLRRGDVYAILLVPDGFQRDIYGSRQTKIECYVSGTNLSASGVIESAVQTVMRTFGAGISISKLETEGMKQHDAILEVMPINTLTRIISNPYLNYGYYLAPIFMFMSIAIFTTLLTIYAIGRELYYSTARQWFIATGGKLTTSTIGKLLPTTVAMILFSQLIFLIIFKLMGMECAGSYLGLTIGSILFIIAYQCVALFIISLTSNLRLALSLGGGYAVMAFTFSGITFPTMAMFDIAQWLSQLFPLTWLSNIFVDQAMRGTPIHYTIPSFIALITFTTLPIIVMRRLRGIMLLPKFWHKD